MSNVRAERAATALTAEVLGYVAQNFPIFLGLIFLVPTRFNYLAVTNSSGPGTSMSTSVRLKVKLVPGLPYL